MQHKYTSEQLKEFRALPLTRKINLTKTRLIEWYQMHDNKCYVSFSGGKDSTVVADLTAQVCKTLGCKLTLWFSDTGLEYPEIKEHVKSYANYLRDRYGIEVDLIIDFPKDKNGKRIWFKDVIHKYGYPIISKDVAEMVGRVQRNGEISRRTGKKSMAAKLLDNEELMPDGNLSKFNIPQWKFLVNADFPISGACCKIMKKNPGKRFNKESGLFPIIGTMTEESMQRRNKWLQNGCNAFDGDHPSSRPISFWTEQDVLAYIALNELPIASVYGDVVFDESALKYYTTGVKRSGCVFCGLGAHKETRPNRFDVLKETHPELYDYCMRPETRGGLNLDHVLTYAKIPH